MWCYIYTFHWQTCKSTTEKTHISCATLPDSLISSNSSMVLCKTNFSMQGNFSGETKAQNNLDSWKNHPENDDPPNETLFFKIAVEWW